MSGGSKAVMTKDQLAKQLKDKYTNMTRDELEALMAKKLVQIGQEEEKMRLVTESIKTSTDQLVHYQKVLMGLVIGAIVIFVVYIGYKVLQVYLGYRKFISWVNNANITPTVWPTGGFGTALCLVYPFMTGWFGFNDVYLPIAAFVTWQQYGTQPLKMAQGTVNDNPTYVLGAMFEFAELGGGAQSQMCGGAQGNDIPAWEVICCGWGNANGVDVCSGIYCDTSFSTLDWINTGSAAFGQGTQGAFAGGMHGGGTTGSVIGFTVMAAIQFGLTYWQTAQQKQANADANGCNGTAFT